MTRSGASFAAAMAAGALLGGFADAHADVYTQTQSFSVTAGDGTTIPVAAVPPMTFQGFNDLLGLPAYASLTQVDVALLDPGPGLYVAQASATITGSEGGTAQLVAGFSVDSPSAPTTFVHSADSGPATIGFTGNPGNSATSTTNNGAGLFVATNATVTGAGLASFLLGPIQFDASITSWNTSGDSGCGLFFADTCTHSATFAGQVTLTYSYTVPEPNSLVLFASAGVLLLGGATWQTLLRRRPEPQPQA